MIDMLARTALALLKTYPASNVFWVAKLAGRTETETTQALVRLEHAGLALRENGLWRLTQLATPPVARARRWPTCGRTYYHQAVASRRSRSR